MEFHFCYETLVWFDSLCCQSALDHPPYLVLTTRCGRLPLLGVLLLRPFPSPIANNSLLKVTAVTAATTVTTVTTETITFTRY